MLRDHRTVSPVQLLLQHRLPPTWSKLAVVVKGVQHLAHAFDDIFSSRVFGYAIDHQLCAIRSYSLVALFVVESWVEQN